MKDRSSKTNRVVSFAKKTGVFRIKDMIAREVHPEYMRRLVSKGILTKSGRGLYSLSDADITENHTLAEACKRVPHGIICLLTALRFHNIGTQAPFEIWMAVDRRAARPRVDYPALRIMRFSGNALKEGIQERRIEGVKVKVYSPAKTVADCFKYRNKIGLDVALEALRECWRSRKCTMDQLWHFAKVCRVSNIMRPYMESLV